MLNLLKILFLILGALLRKSSLKALIFWTEERLKLRKRKVNKENLIR
ncbi:hypothetical protein DB41_AE00150 [Neochlamydia sp. TUME1]|nr:hypothetical protein DB41_AE00150 [Neochlamydia sp. TUME1]